MSDCFEHEKDEDHGITIVPVCHSTPDTLRVIVQKGDQYAQYVLPPEGARALAACLLAAADEAEGVAP